MSDSAAVIALVSAMIGTYVARSGLILLLADRTLPTTVERALQNVAPAVLAALTINLAVSRDGLGSVEFAEGSALIVAAAVAVWRKNLIWTLVAGMATLWLLGAVT